MVTRYYLFYKEDYKDRQKTMRIYKTREEAEKSARWMIEQFRFWGGGSVPVSLSASKWRKNGKYAGEAMEAIYFPESDYIDYARENGNLYGYYNC